MSRTRWVFILALIFTVVLAACQPAATPTPSPRPPATAVPPTEAPTEVVVPTEEVTLEAVAPTEEVAISEATEVVSPTEEVTSEATVEMTAEVGDLVEVAAQAGDFSTLLLALDEAGLSDTLKGAGPFTVFAPTDEAFEALLDATGMTADELLNSDELADILLYHVVSGKVTSDDLENYRSTDNPDLIVVPTLDDDQTLSITFADDGTVKINDTATVTLTNVEASNGVIHVIDVVLMPPAPEATPEATELATIEVVMLPTDEVTEVPAEEISTPEATVAPVDGGTEETVASGDAVTVAADGNVVIGLAVGLSGEGIAPLGTDIQRGAELALADRPTVTVGGQEFNVELNVQDDQCSADGGQAVANRFASDSEIAGVVGPMCSSACLAAAPIFDAANYTTISPSCTGAVMTTSGFTSFNRAAVSDVFQGQIAATFIYDVLGVRSIATIHDGSPYAEGLVNVVADEFAALGGEVVSSDAVQVGDTDFRGLLDDIAQADPDLIYFVGFPAEASRLIQQRADAGLEDVTFMSADGVFGTEVVNLAGEASEGLYVTSGIPASSTALTDFLDRYVAVYGEEPPAPYHANGYDAVNIFLDAIEAVGTVDADGSLVIDRAALSAYIRSLSSFAGLTGTLSNDGTGELFTFGEFGIAQVKDGAFVQVYTGTVTDGVVALTEFMSGAIEAATAEATEAAPVEVATEAAPVEEATAEATASS